MRGLKSAYGLTALHFLASGQYGVAAAHTFAQVSVSLNPDNMREA